MHKAIKRHAGLSEYEDAPIRAEVEAIVRALYRNGYVITEKLNDPT